jgi:16S rRNA A1518/A1519 N6-dimethyltransferase RsmA/KsgA/DIM1 with predicted DNA glycosylase/AP lyase activity
MQGSQKYDRRTRTISTSMRNIFHKVKKILSTFFIDKKQKRITSTELQQITSEKELM